MKITNTVGKALSITLAFAFSPLAFAAPAELTIEVQKASMAFNTFIRVELAAKVVEADDSAVLGESSPFLETLSYGASKDSAFTGTFKSQAELDAKVQGTLCQESHDIELSPYRENGVMGMRKFRQKVRPFFIQLTGTLTTAAGSGPFASSVVCKK